MTLLYLSREMKTKKAETARYSPTSGSTSEETSTSTSISMDLLLVKVSRPDTVRTEPGTTEEKEGKCVSYHRPFQVCSLNTLSWRPLLASVWYLS